MRGWVRVGGEGGGVRGVRRRRGGEERGGGEGRRRGAEERGGGERGRREGERGGGGERGREGDREGGREGESLRLGSVASAANTDAEAIFGRDTSGSSAAGQYHDSIDSMTQHWRSE